MPGKYTDFLASKDNKSSLSCFVARNKQKNLKENIVIAIAFEIEQKIKQNRRC
jgi:hypothetical protein